MKKLSVSVLIASALTLNFIPVGALAAGNHHGEHGGTTIGSPGDPGQVSRTIEITMVDNRFRPSEIEVKQGETIRFVLKNTGKKKHEIMIGTREEIDKHGKMMKKFPDMEHPDEPNMITVDPGKTRELIWHFAEAGEVNFACPLPGHFKGMNFPGMKGTIKVEAK
ncbi:MAG: cupredoxin family protein [Nitrosospira sp.]|nr:cupredoxin family protein [Nitrosospira sp.]